MIASFRSHLAVAIIVKCRIEQNYVKPHTDAILTEHVLSWPNRLHCSFVTQANQWRTVAHMIACVSTAGAGCTPR